MTQRKLLFASLLSIVALSAYADSSSSVTPTLALRSQGRHADRQKWVGETNHTNLFDQQPWYGTWDIDLAYMSSFRSNRLAQCLFGSDIVCDADVESDNDCNECGGSTILVQGSSVADRNAKAWLADYLYLNCDYNGSFSVKPRITNVMIDLDFYLGLDKVVSGMYLRFYGPITWTKWKTNFQAHDPETVSTATCGIGYFTPSGTEEYLKSVASYFKGETIESVDGVIFEGLKYAQMPNCHQSKAGFADLRGELGWNFYQAENYHVGVNIQAAAPTGNRRYAQYVMQPVVGNGHHWELGAGLSAHYTFKCGNSDKSFGIYFDANITHLFKATESRTFDLKDRNNSRYMLATKFTNNVCNFAQPTTTVAQLSGVPTAGTTTPRTPALYQFDSVYSPVANISTFDVQVSIPVQADVVAMLNFSCRNLSFDLGYNLWARNCEKITTNVCCDPCDTSLNCSEQKNTWALKGDSRMFGFLGTADASGAAVGTSIALSASQNKATIHNGTNAAAVTTSCLAKENCGVDNSQFAIMGTTPTPIIHTPLYAGGTNSTNNQVKTSIQPIFLSTADVAFVETRGLSNKVFANLSRTWNDREGWKPYLGIGGSAEFGSSCGCGSSDNGDCETACEENSCSTCTSCAVSQWAVWIKGGYAF